MLYRHTPRFQSLLQTALLLASHDKDYSDQKMIDAAGLTCGKSTLNRFLRSALKLDPESVDQPITRVAASYLNSRDAAHLWDYLDNKRGLIENAVALKNLPKKSLYPLEEVANVLHCFYGVHKSSIARLAFAGISGRFFCYKPSFRKRGFIVKSLMSLEPKNNDYYLVTETQRTSGKYEIDRIAIVERSNGFGFIKSDRLWLFLQDVETEQPRLFCLKPKFGRPAGENSFAEIERESSKISSLRGHLIEGAKGNKNDEFGFKVALVREDVEVEQWKEMWPGQQFKADDQIDVYPGNDEQKHRFERQLTNAKVFIPDEIVRYLQSGFDPDEVES
jgi:hypothetical protein